MDVLWQKALKDNHPNKKFIIFARNARLNNGRLSMNQNAFFPTGN